MTLTRVAAFSLAALIVFLLLSTTLGDDGLRTRLGLGAWGSGFVARAVAADPPGLWLAETLDGEGSVRGSARLCADRALRRAFTHPLPQINGQPCRDTGRPLERDGLYATRCDAVGHRYSLNVASHGDPERDLTVWFDLKSLERDDPGQHLVTRYRWQGACPSGWRIGDTMS
jgi:hypothetical protein